MGGQESRHWPPLGRGHCRVLDVEEVAAMVLELRSLAFVLEDLQEFAHAVEIQRGARDRFYVPTVTVVR